MVNSTGWKDYILHFLSLVTLNARSSVVNPIYKMVHDSNKYALTIYASLVQVIFAWFCPECTFYNASLALSSAPLNLVTGSSKLGWGISIIIMVFIMVSTCAFVMETLSDFANQDFTHEVCYTNTADALPCIWAYFHMCLFLLCQCCWSTGEVGKGEFIGIALFPNETLAREQEFECPCEPHSFAEFYLIEVSDTTRSTGHLEPPFLHWFDSESITPPSLGPLPSDNLCLNVYDWICGTICNRGVHSIWLRHRWDLMPRGVIGSLMDGVVHFSSNTIHRLGIRPDWVERRGGSSHQRRYLLVRIKSVRLLVRVSATELCARVPTVCTIFHINTYAIWPTPIHTNLFLHWQYLKLSLKFQL